LDRVNAVVKLVKQAHGSAHKEDLGETDL
jgi:hypothetical protein